MQEIYTERAEPSLALETPAVKRRGGKYTSGKIVDPPTADLDPGPGRAREWGVFSWRANVRSRAGMGRESRVRVPKVRISFALARFGANDPCAIRFSKQLERF